LLAAFASILLLTPHALAAALLLQTCRTPGFWPSLPT